MAKRIGTSPLATPHFADRKPVEKTKEPGATSVQSSGTVREEEYDPRSEIASRYAIPTLSDEELERVREVLRSGRIQSYLGFNIVSIVK